MPSLTDIPVTMADFSRLTSAEEVAGWLTALGYDTSARKALTPQAIGLTPEAAAAFKQIELVSEDAEGFLRVVFCQLRSLTAKSRNDLARVLGRQNVDHLLILTSDFSTLEFVLLDKRRRDARGPGGTARIQVVPLVLAVPRRAAGTKELRTLRRLTWTSRDGLEQFDKLRTTFAAAAFSEDYFCNRALFADHYLVTRLREDAAWRENPSAIFQEVKSLLADARGRWLGRGEAVVRRELFEPLFKLLGFDPVARPPSAVKPDSAQSRATGPHSTTPDYLLGDPTGRPLTAAFVYAWDRWLDGPDFQLDAETPDENPGASVVSALDAGLAEWIVVTNGRQWRLYSRQAHSRATNFYEVDLAEALLASGDTDPNEAFRYWWLFFRRQAFEPVAQSPSTVLTQPGAVGPHVAQPGYPRAGAAVACWLDAIAGGSRDYAKELGERLKSRVFLTIFPHLARGFLEDRKTRLGRKGRPSDEELRDVFEATLTLLYRLLFLLYAEARDLLPIRESAYREASLRRIKEEIAEAAGIAESEVDQRLKKAYSASDTTLYDRLARLFAAMDRGDAALNVPTYNGGLFMGQVAQSPSAVPHQPRAAGPQESREDRIARFLIDHKVPDRALALAIDHLARDPDDKTFQLVFIDYKSLEVRHLGSIYEGLLEFQLKLADEDLTTQSDKKGEKYIPLGQAKPRRGRSAEIVVAAGHVYLSNDKAQRKASGSYYTPDPIVKYIVEQAVGPVLAEKLEALRPEFRKVRKTFDNELQKATAFPVKKAETGKAETGTGSFCAQHPQGRPGKTNLSPFPQDDSSFWDPREFAAEKTYAECRGLVERLFEFRVLDPAMGSGHFLVEAVDFITDRLLTFLNQFPINPVTFMLARTRRNILEALAEQGVSVDPDKLTDVNLLKRHVLKRCIYGVDLNPMAVELAKVSLWLDAFTLGAPLSFLDHHLRSGNSLIGGSWKDLLDATARRLFPINFERLVEAVRQVLEINRSPDATVSEVKRSESAYAEARGKLSGFRIVFDILTAKYFGFADAVELLQHGQELELGDRARFIHSLDNLQDRSDVEKIETLAAEPELHFFHWEIEFPEAFFSFIDVNQRHIRHKNEISEASAGFDAVIGNPPYVRMELIKPIKSFLKPRFRCHAERADLFIYFFEQALRLLHRNGRSAFISSSTWTRTNAGERLRELLKSEASIETFLDFGDLPVFPEATTYPAVTVIKRAMPEPSHEIVAAIVPELDNEDLSQALFRRAVHVPQASLESTGWYLEDRRVAALRDKIRAAGVTLKEYCGSPLYGIKTGLNEAFVVDALTCERLIAEDHKSKEILKRFLEGKDLKPWRYEWRGLWLIYTFHGVKIDRYPAIKAYLSTFRRRLEERATSDHHAWYELQQPQVAYSKMYEVPKIIYPHFAVTPEFSFDSEGFFGNDKTYCIPGQSHYLLGLLNSSILWFMVQQIAAKKRGGWSELRVQYMDTIPIAKASAADQKAIATIAESLSSSPCSGRREVELELNDRVAALYRLTDVEKRLVEGSVSAGASSSSPKD